MLFHDELATYFKPACMRTHCRCAHATPRRRGTACTPSAAVVLHPSSSTLSGFSESQACLHRGSVIVMPWYVCALSVHLHCAQHVSAAWRQLPAPFHHGRGHSNKVCGSPPGRLPTPPHPRHCVVHAVHAHVHAGSSASVSGSLSSSATAAASANATVAVCAFVSDVCAAGRSVDVAVEAWAQATARAFASAYAAVYVKGYTTGVAMPQWHTIISSYLMLWCASAVQASACVLHAQPSACAMLSSALLCVRTSHSCCALQA